MGLLRGATRTAALIVLLSTTALQAQISPPNDMGIASPAESFPQEPGSDYFLADYTQYEAYLKTLDQQSDRMQLVDFGQSEEGRTMWMAVVSAPENLARLDHYKSIARRLAKAEGLTDEEARALAAEGKAVVWIDAGLHATETVTTQSQIHVLYRMLTQNDPETLRILDDVIVLFAHDNPDGLELVADWYMRNEEPTEREFRTIPRLYQKYIGHDNNRDSYMANMAETENINRVLFREWFPQIIFNQHQTGPAGMVVFVPPFRDPFNYNYEPLLMSQLQELGTSMHSRLIGEDKPGSGMRSAAPYSTWHNGMVRSVSYFHNSLGLLTEIIGGPTPEMIPLVPSTQLARNDEPLPIAPQEWHLADSLEYQWSLDRAVMDYASRNRDRLLYNIYQMGRNGIEDGQTDSWTTTPDDVHALERAAETHPLPEGTGFYRGQRLADPSLYNEVLRDPARRDPRAYVISASQRDMPSTIAFLNTLLKNGVDIERADAAFTAGGVSYPAGSFVVSTAQAYRPHVLDMFEPQDHPDDLAYPGGPPVPPYDITGYTLVEQMGVDYDRVFESVDGPFTRVTDDLLAPPPGRIVGTGNAGWLLRHETNNSFILTNRLLAAGLPVSWVEAATSADGVEFAPGAVWVPASDASRRIVTDSVGPLGINAYAVAAAPSEETIALRPVRIGLVDQYGGVMPSGWTRWLLEEFEFPFKVVFPPELDAGNLNANYDVLLFPNGTVPGDGELWRGRGSSMPEPGQIPAEYRSQLGLVSAERTVPQLNAFARAGGTVIAVGSATQLATLLDAPLTPALATTEDGEPAALDEREFYIPGALLEARVDPAQPLAYGLPPTVNLFFDEDQTFTMEGGTGADRISWFDSAEPLHSGWALGQDKLQGTTAIADVDVGQGKLLVMGTDVSQRGQPYETFKFLFNGLLYGPAAAGER